MIKQLLRKLFGGKKKMNTGNAFPEGWSLTIDDLMEEMKQGKIKSIGERERTWAREYERSLIPAGYRFPKKGDLYAADVDQEIDFLTAWSAPYTGGGTATLYKDEQVWVDEHPSEEKPIGAYLIPVKYAELEQRMVEQSDRTSLKYGGFYFYISTKTLNEHFSLIRKGFSKNKYV